MARLQGRVISRVVLAVTVHKVKMRAAVGSQFGDDGTGLFVLACDLLDQIDNAPA